MNDATVFTYHVCAEAEGFELAQTEQGVIPVRRTFKTDLVADCSRLILSNEDLETLRKQVAPRIPMSPDPELVTITSLSFLGSR